MQRVSFDLRRVRDENDFYRQFAQKLEVAEFGENLDALWDTLTGGIHLPLHITLRHLSRHPDRAALKRIVDVMQEAERETGGEFSVSVY